ncbi:MAG: hypothetical protein WBV11_03915 [Salegentibacter sp.]
MGTLEEIIQNFGGMKEGGLTHRRPFLNIRNSEARACWYNRRRHGN